MTPSPQDTTADAAPELPATVPVDSTPERPADETHAHPATESSDRVRGIVDDIRRRLGELAARELELRRRDQEIEKRYGLLQQAARNSAAAEFEEAQHRLEVRSAELNAQSVELAARTARIKQLEERLRQRSGDQQQAQAELARAGEQLRARGEAEHRQRQEERRILLNRVAVIRRREEELERRIQLARDQIVAERNQLSAARTEIEAASAELTHLQEQLKSRTAELAQRHETLRSQGAQLEQRQDELAAERADIDGRRLALQQSASEIEHGRAALLEKQREIERRYQVARQQQTQVERQREELENRRRLLQQAQAEVEARTQRQESREQQQRERAASLQLELQRLEEFERELQQRRTTIDGLLEQAAETERSAAEHREQAQALREQAETREADSRQAALLLEIERQQLDSQRAGLELATEDLDGLRARREREFEQARRELGERAALVREAERSFLAAPPRWWRRNLALAMTAGLVCGGAWFVWERPQYRAVSELRVTSESADTARVNAEHRLALLDSRLLDGSPEFGDLAPVWRVACTQGRVEVLPEADRTALHLRLSDTDGRRARQLVYAAAQVYAQRLNAVPADERLPEQYRDVETWRAALAAELAGTDAERAQLRAAVAGMTPPEAHARTSAELAGLRAEHQTVAARLSEERARLAMLLSEQTPGGTVDQTAFDAQLAQDTVYQEDFKEFRAEGVQYRTELGVALLMCSDPAVQVQKTLQKLAKALGEQRELSPPPTVAAVLERTTADVAQANERLPRFIESWQARVELAGRLNVDQDVVEAVKLQNAAADEVHGVVDAVQKLVEDARARIEALERDSNGGTREVVVASVLRGELSGLSGAVQALAEAAKATDLSANFRLETHDRQLRGLRTRLAQRRDTLNQQMQLEADRIARQEHTQQIEKTRDAVREAEQRREELVTALMSKLDLVRDLEQEAVQRDQAQARLRQTDERTAWLNGCIAQLDEKLAQARRSGPKPDRIERDDPLVAPIESHRARHAGLAAVAGFAAAGLIGLLMLVRNPLRRRATTPRLLDLLMAERSAPAIPQNSARAGTGDSP